MSQSLQNSQRMSKLNTRNGTVAYRSTLLTPNAHEKIHQFLSSTKWVVYKRKSVPFLWLTGVYAIKDVVVYKTNNQHSVSVVVQLVGWTIQMSAATRRLSGPATMLNDNIIRLTLSKAAVWTVDDVAGLITWTKEFLYIYFILTLGSIWSWGTTKIRSITKLYSVYIFTYYINIQNASCSRFYKCKGIRPVKTEWWGAGVVICVERGADLHMAKLMPLPLRVSCFSKIQIVFTFLVLAHR